MINLNPFINKRTMNTANASKFNYKKELFDFVDKKRKELNLTYRDIAYMFPGNNKNKIINEFMKFQSYERMNKFYFNDLLKILNISREEKIWSTPELSNISFYGMGFSYAYISRDFPLTLGELLYHYETKSFVIENQEEPEYPTYIYYSCGSMLSGSNSYNGFNLKSRKPFYDRLSYGCGNQLIAISNYKKPNFPVIPSDLSLKQFINTL